MKVFSLKDTEIKVEVSNHFKPYFSIWHDYFSDGKAFNITVNEKLGDGFSFNLKAPINRQGEHYICTTLRSGKQQLTSKTIITKDEAQKIIDLLKIDNSEPVKKLLISYLWMPVSATALTQPKSKTKHKVLSGQLDMFEVM